MAPRKTLKADMTNDGLLPTLQGNPVRTNFYNVSSSRYKVFTLPGVGYFGNYQMAWYNAILTKFGLFIRRVDIFKKNTPARLSLLYIDVDDTFIPAWVIEKLAIIEELRHRRQGKGRLWFSGYLMQLEGEGGVIVRQNSKKRLVKIWWDLTLGPSYNWLCTLPPRHVKFFKNRYLMDCHAAQNNSSANSWNWMENQPKI